jgi:hypothetical protein
MEERTFRLSDIFIETVFERFSRTLKHLRSGAESEPYHQFIARVVEPYNRVTIDDLGAFIEAAFWASMTTEEGRYHNFRVSFGPPTEYPPPSSWDYLFEQPRPYSAHEISSLAPTLAKSYRRIGVWYSSTGDLEIWGVASIPYWNMEISTTGSGQLLFSMLGGAEGSFDVAVSGSWWGFVDNSRLPITWAYFGGTRPDNLFQLDRDIISKALLRRQDYESITKSMLQHRQGGTLLIVPEDHERWRQSVAGIKYQDRFEKVREDADEHDNAIKRRRRTRTHVFRDADTEPDRQAAMESLEFVGQMTALDGAVLLGRDLTVYGFGAKLQPVDSDNKPEKALLSRPFEDAPYESVPVSDLGGTRHQSAAQFVHDQRDCVAIVCSQDGRLSALSWDGDHDCVQVITSLEYAL